ncbi:MAG: hypothetical protein V3V08_23780 [Nannocystaceae bacterium]
MFSFGLLEIGLLVVVAIVLFPPHELPKLARSVARFYGSIRRVADDFRATVLEDADIGEPIREIRTAYQQTRWQLRQAEQAARRDIASAQASVRGITQASAPADKKASVAEGTVDTDMLGENETEEETRAEGTVDTTAEDASTPATPHDGGIEGRSMAGSGVEGKNVEAGKVEGSSVGGESRVGESRAGNRGVGSLDDPSAGQGAA